MYVCIVAKRYPFIGALNFGKWKKSAGSKSSEYGGSVMITILFLAKNSRTSIDMCAGVLSWCKIHDWFLPQFCLFLMNCFAQSAHNFKVPYWPYNLVARIPLQSIETVSKTFAFNQNWRALFSFGSSTKIIGFDFNVIAIHLWFVSNYDLFGEIWIVVNISWAIFMRPCLCLKLFNFRTIFIAASFMLKTFIKLLYVSQTKRQHQQQLFSNSDSMIIENLFLHCFNVFIYWWGVRATRTSIIIIIGYNGRTDDTAKDKISRLISQHTTY